MMKRAVVSVICIVALLLCVTFAVKYYVTNSEVEDLARNVADTENEIARINAANSEVRIEVMSSVGGLDERRINDDASNISNMFFVAFTWLNYEEYNEMRKTLINDYGLDENGQFLTDVFGYIPVSEHDLDYNYIDSNNVRIEYMSTNLYCIGVSGTNYNYFGEIRFRSLGQAGSSYYMTYAFMLTTDIDGNINNLFVMDITK